MTDAEEFIVIICLNAAVLKNVLVGLHEIRGNYLEKATICRFTLDKRFFGCFECEKIVGTASDFKMCFSGRFNNSLLKKKCELS